MLPPIARRFVAGETAAEAIAHARSVVDDDIGVLLNLLGEAYTAPAAVERDLAAYHDLIGDLDTVDPRACISIKPTQLGLHFGAEVLGENIEQLAEIAAESDRRIWIDMEDASTTDATLAAFERARSVRGADVGVCLQSNLRRTDEDLARYAAGPGRIRLVKGAYSEDPSIAYPDHHTVNTVYRRHLHYLFEHADGGIAVASHDPEMLSLAAALHDRYGTPYEVQMLMGVQTDTQRDLAAQGVDVWQYVPYGSAWFAYFFRRIFERKENLLFALRAVLGP